MVYGGILKTTRHLSHLDVAVDDALRVDEAEGREQVEGHLDGLELADAAVGARLGFGRIVASEVHAPNM